MERKRLHRRWKVVPSPRGGRLLLYCKIQPTKSCQKILTSCLQDKPITRLMTMIAWITKWTTTCLVYKKVHSSRTQVKIFTMQKDFYIDGITLCLKIYITSNTSFSKHTKEVIYQCAMLIALAPSQLSVRVIETLFWTR